MYELKNYLRRELITQTREYVSVPENILGQILVGTFFEKFFEFLLHQSTQLIELSSKTTFPTKFGDHTPPFFWGGKSYTLVCVYLFFVRATMCVTLRTTLCMLHSEYGVTQLFIYFGV